MKKYNHEMTYTFYLMKHIKSGKLKISSFHNKEGVCNPGNNYWMKVSDKLGTITVSNRKKYLEYKKELETKYLT